MAKSNLGKILAGITIIGAGVALGLAVYNKLDAIEHELDNDEFEDDGLDFERTIECPCCHNKITVDLSDYEYDTSSYENENGMGPDCVYSFDSGEEIICDKCGAILNVSGWIREYPLGAYDSEDIDVDVIEIE